MIGRAIMCAVAVGFLGMGATILITRAERDSALRDLNDAKAELASCQINRAAVDMKGRIQDEIESLDEDDLLRRGAEWLLAE